LLAEEDSLFDIDIGKIVIIINSDVSGKDISDILVNEFKIQPEAYNLHHIIFMTSVGDCKNNYACFDKLISAISALEKRYKFKRYKFKPYLTEEIFVPEMTVRDAFYAPKHSVLLETSVNHICGENVYAYPPGIPILVCGSVITQDKIDYLKHLKNSGITIVGSDLKTISTADPIYKMERK
jgi:arginine decarboxylase